MRYQFKLNKLVLRNVHAFYFPILDITCQMSRSKFTNVTYHISGITCCRVQFTFHA